MAIQPLGHSQTKGYIAVLRVKSPSLTANAPMKLLNTYDDRDEAEAAAEKITGEKRDSTVVIYNLFGMPSWGNFHRLGMYNLVELKALLDRRATWQPADQLRHAEILATLRIVAKNFQADIPSHWL